MHDLVQAEVGFLQPPAKEASELRSEREITMLPCRPLLPPASNHLQATFHIVKTPSENPPFATAGYLFGCAFGI